MKRLLFIGLPAVAVAMAVVGCSQPTPTNENVESFELGKFDLHIYTSAEAMGDVTLIIEGERGLVVVEPQSFYKSIEDFNSYIDALGKPVEKVVANYHAGGLANCDIDKVVMVEPMVEFMKGPMAQGMMKKFAGAFDGAMDTRMIEPQHTVGVESCNRWCGVDFVFSSGAANDFPASNINIGGKVYYTHFAPNRAHPAPMQLSSMEGVEAMLSQMQSAKESACEVFIGSHGSVATMADVCFLIDYLNKVISARAECDDAAGFVATINAAYPDLSGSEKLAGIAANLYQ